jgi:hypothetical protein
MYTTALPSSVDLLELVPQVTKNSSPKSVAENQKAQVASELSEPEHERFLLRYSETRPLKVCIIHGDPSKPNDILPGGKWDEDDFYTIQRAKQALDQLGPAYQFTWLCNHDTLLEDLRRLKQEKKVDLVLQVIYNLLPSKSRITFVAVRRRLDEQWAHGNARCSVLGNVGSAIHRRRS